MVALYGTKIGMSQVFDVKGSLVPVTVIHINPNLVLGRKNVDKGSKFPNLKLTNNIEDDSKKKNIITKTVLGAFKMKQKSANKAKIGLFKELELRKKIFEVEGFENIELGAEIGVEIFETINFVDVVGTSKGKGFQGVIKRHNAKGGPRTHGSKFHRTNGSTGHSSNPSRVRKGTTMAGKMGNDTVTVQNLKVVSIDKDKQIIMVRGAIPGSIGGEVIVKNSIKKDALL